MNALKGLIASKKNELKKSQQGNVPWIDNKDAQHRKAEQEAASAAAKVKEGEARHLAELAAHFKEAQKRIRKGEESSSDEGQELSMAAKRRKLEAEPLPDNWLGVEEKLRKRGEPVRLFGESKRATYVRMRELEDGLHPEPEIRRESANDTDTDDLLASSRRGSANMGGQASPSNDNGGSVADIPASLSDTEKVRQFVKRCLRRWEAELDTRSVEEKKSLEGRNLTNMCQQTRRDLRPLLKKIRDNQLEVEIASKLGSIVDFCVQREYVRAHDKYIELAIGNAAWPMGVTMVGIHERVGRSKIFSSEIAHILNDETTRKYIQMIKRLMTLCQDWHPTDPSLMVSMATTKAIQQSSKDEFRDLLSSSSSEED